MYARFVLQKRVSCLNHEFDIWSPFEGGENVTGESMIGESSADHIGFQVAFEAYEELRNGSEVKLPGLPDLTPQQFFFVLQSFYSCDALPYNQFKSKFSRGMTHPISVIRVNRGVGHSQYFVEAFNCTEKNKLFRKKMCSIFD